MSDTVGNISNAAADKANKAGDKASDAANDAKKSVQGGSQHGGIIDQATQLVGDTLQYAKQTVIGGNKSVSEKAEDVKNDAQKTSAPGQGKTLGDLVNQSRDLAGDIVGAVANVVEGGQKKVEEAAKEADNSAPGQKSYVDQARGLAASVLHTAENLIHATSDKASEIANADRPLDKAADVARDATNKAADSAKKTADDVSNSNVAKDAKGAAQDAKSKADATAKDAKNEAQKASK